MRLEGRCGAFSEGTKPGSIRRFRLDRYGSEEPATDSGGKS